MSTPYLVTGQVDDITGSESKFEQHHNVRLYHIAPTKRDPRRTFIGVDTFDVEYFCSRRCQDRLLSDLNLTGNTEENHSHIGGPVYRTGKPVGNSYQEYEWGTSWSSDIGINYDVHCATCEEFIAGPEDKS